MTIGGILAVQNIPFSQDKVVNEVIQGTATSATVIMGMGHAGVGDLTTAVVAGLAGVASLIAGIVPDSENIRDNIKDLVGIPDLPTLPGLTAEQSQSTWRRSLLNVMPFGIGNFLKWISASVSILGGLGMLAILHLGLCILSLEDVLVWPSLKTDQGG